MPGGGTPARRVGMVTRLGRDRRDEDLLDRRPDGQFRVHHAHELAIERLALDRIDFRGGVVDDLVNGRIGPAPLIGPGCALGLAGAIPHGCSIFFLR